MRFFLVLLFLLPSSIVLSAEATTKKSEEQHWKGEAELGLLTTSGNTRTQTLNTKLGVEYKKDSWTHYVRYEKLRAEDNDAVTANRDMLLYRARYQLPQARYLFGSLRYDDDPFAGYDTRTTEVIGYGFQFINKEMLKWDVEVGAGAKQTDKTDNTQTNEAVARLATNLEWRFSDTSTFKQEVFIERGSQNTQTESTSDLKVKINSSLAMKLSFKVKNNSNVPAGKKNTDTETAVTLVYDFFN